MGALQRQVQKYLSAEKAYRSRNVSGETEANILENSMRLYCKRNKKRDSCCVERDGPALKLMQAVQILRKCRKFGSLDTESTPRAGPSTSFVIEQKE